MVGERLVDVSELYKYWVSKIGEDRIILKYPSLRGLYDWFLRETDRLKIDPETVDFEALVDPTLTYKENQRIFSEYMTVPPSEKEYEQMSKELTAMMEKEVREKYPEVIEPLADRIAELETEADKKKKYQKLVKELRLELGETIRKLEQEKAKPPEVKAVKIRVLKDFREGIIDYKSGQIIDTRDLEWVLQKIEQGLIERFKPEAPPPTVPVPPKKEARVKVKVEAQAEKGEYIARMMFDIFEAGFIGFRTTDRLDDWLRAGREIVNWRDNLRAAGFSPEEVEEELKTYPEPFKQGVDVQVHWIYPEDVSFDATAQKYWNVFHTPYEKAMLEIKSVEELKNIAQIKGLRVVETKDELINIILGIQPPVVLFPPTKPRELTRDEVQKLQDLWSSMLFRELGRVPTNAMATFRVELEKVKSKPYPEAQEHILKVADELISEFIARKAIEPLAPREPRRIEVYRPPPEEEFAFVPSRVPRTVVPKEPLEPEEMKFPRGPSRREHEVLWDVFRYRLQEQGYNPFDYQDEFEEYIASTQFQDWKDLVEKFEFFVESIKKGKALPPLWQWRGAPIPVGLEGVLRKTPAERLQDVIVHFTSVVIRNARTWGKVPTLEDLRKELEERGLIPPDMIITPVSPLYDEIKNALLNAYKRKDVWLTNITLEELNSFLET